MTSRSLAAVPGISTLTYCTAGSSRASSASWAADSRVLLSGASWIMIGMSMAAATVRNQSRTAGPSTLMVAPKNGGISMTRSAPSSWARRLRSAAIRAL
jgi:hypothetical protein